jgi:hypothetical protein
MAGKLATEFHMSQQAIDAFGTLVGLRAPHLKRKPGTGHHSDPAAAKSVGLRGPVLWIGAAGGLVVAVRFLSDWNRKYRELWLDRERPGQDAPEG